jgi:hypothetical protein
VRLFAAIALLVWLAPLPAVAQVPGDTSRAGPIVAPASSPDDTVDAVRLGLVSGLTAGAFIYGHVLQTNMWWKGERSDFHFEWKHDWSYSLGADKLGHAWFPYAIAHTYDELFRWARVDSTTSIWTAASLALGYQTYIEVRDGFSAEWGFSWGDFAADAIGAALPVAQHYVPTLGLVDFKMSFYPSERFLAGANRAIIDDYESSYHWLTLHVADVIPADWRDHYPAFVDLALGHGVKGLDGAGGGTHEIFVALDWNLDELPGDWWGWNLLRHALRHYHLPVPPF